MPSDKNLDESYDDEEDFDIEKPQEISEDDQESIDEQNFASQIRTENQMEKDFANQTNYNQSSSHNTFLAGNSGSQNIKLPVLKPEEDDSASFMNQQQQNYNLNMV